MKRRIQLSIYDTRPALEQGSNRAERGFHFFWCIPQTRRYSGILILVGRSRAGDDAALAVAVLIWLINAGPGYLGYGTSLLWAGAPKSGEHAFYDIAVTPGNRTVRRKAVIPRR